MRGGGPERRAAHAVRAATHSGGARGPQSPALGLTRASAQQSLAAGMKGQTGERPGRGPCPLPASPPGEGSLPRDSTAVTAALRADTGGQGGVCCLFWRQVYVVRLPRASGKNACLAARPLGPRPRAPEQTTCCFVGAEEDSPTSRGRTPPVRPGPAGTLFLHIPDQVEIFY